MTTGRINQVTIVCRRPATQSPEAAGRNSTRLAPKPARVLLHTSHRRAQIQRSRLGAAGAALDNLISHSQFPRISSTTPTACTRRAAVRLEIPGGGPREGGTKATPTQDTPCCLAVGIANGHPSTEPNSGSRQSRPHRHYQDFFS